MANTIVTEESVTGKLMVVFSAAGRISSDLRMYINVVNSDDSISECYLDLNLSIDVNSIGLCDWLMSKDHVLRLVSDETATGTKLRVISCQQFANRVLDTIGYPDVLFGHSDEVKWQDETSPFILACEVDNGIKSLDVLTGGSFTSGPIDSSVVVSPLDSFNVVNSTTVFDRNESLDPEVIVNTIERNVHVVSKRTKLVRTERVVPVLEINNA